MSTISEEINSIREQLGERLLILGHHYQRSAVLGHADETGDSLELARKAASRPEAERIVFCGVRFMAESADVLSGDEQKVYMPESRAGCPMADMANADDMREALDGLSASGDWLPVVYVNSSADIKAICGQYGGSTCTSSNAASVFKWVIDQGKRILFLPDEHLGVNTAYDLGIPDDLVAVYDPAQEGGGLTPTQLAEAQVVAWKGYCLVHAAFTIDHVKAVRELLPAARIIVHPETPKEVVRECDAHGSTSQIIKYVEAAEDGATIIIGTELNLVQRLAELHGDRLTIKVLSPSVCANMSRTNERNLLDLFQAWPDDNVVTVPDNTAVDARRSLNMMLSL